MKSNYSEDWDYHLRQINVTPPAGGELPSTSNDVSATHLAEGGFSPMAETRIKPEWASLLPTVEQLAQKVRQALEQSKSEK